MNCPLLSVIFKNNEQRRSRKARKLLFISGPCRARTYDLLIKSWALNKPASD